MNDEQSGAIQLNQMLGGYWISQAIYVAAELGLADELAEGPRSVEQLADRTGSNSGALYRVLRALASVGIFDENGDRSFSLTPLGGRLRSDAPGSQRSFAIMSGAEFYETWGRLLHSVRTGEEGFHKAFGKRFFEYMTEHPDRHGIYDAAMTGVHGGETQPMLDAYDFSPFQTVTDIGGGNGLLLAGILERHPAVNGILFDLPAVADRARPVVSSLGISDRCRVVGGDFFSSVPAGCDAYVMRHIIHDWQDDEAIAILRNCREAMNPEGRVLVVECVIPPGNGPSFGKWLDLMMLLVGGRERTEDEFRRLFSEAGLTLNRVIPTASDVSVVEGVRAA